MSDDLISRKRTQSLFLTALTYKERIGKLSWTTAEVKQWIVDFVEDLPSAQPEIIRCKDCKHRFVDGDNVRFNVCELNHNKVQADDWFCADAERRTDERTD